MKSKKFKRTQFYDPILKFGFTLQIGACHVELAQWLNKKYKASFNTEPLNCLGCFMDDGSNKYRLAIWVKKFDYEIINHEITHACLHIAQVLRLGTRNSEVLPSYAEYLMRRFIDLKKG
jgi:cytochrome c